MRKFSLVGALLVALFAVAGRVSAADQMSSVYDQQKLTDLYNEIMNSPAKHSEAVSASPEHYVAGWYCVAAPYGNTLIGWTWWLSPNLSYSQYMALGSCTQAYGYVCRVACNWQF